MVSCARPGLPTSRVTLGDGTGLDSEDFQGFRSPRHYDGSHRFPDQAASDLRGRLTLNPKPASGRRCVGLSELPRRQGLPEQLRDVPRRKDGGTSSHIPYPSRRWQEDECRPDHPACSSRERARCRPSQTARLSDADLASLLQYLTTNPTFMPSGTPAQTPAAASGCCSRRSAHAGPAWRFDLPSKLRVLSRARRRRR